MLEPVTLEGTHVRLEPMNDAHFDGLLAAAQDDSIWAWTLQVVRTPAEMRAYMAQAIAGRAAGKFLPFTTIDRASGTIVGATRYDAIDETHRGLEIGWTWINPRWQRTAINTEAKLLMLQHAFETIGCIRVQLKTDSLNLKSRTAIARLGAIEEGTIRNHYIVAHSGRIRHSVLFSITDAEWPAVRANLQAKLSANPLF